MSREHSIVREVEKSLHERQRPSAAEAHFARDMHARAETPRAREHEKTIEQEFPTFSYHEAMAQRSAILDVLASTNTADRKKILDLQKELRVINDAVDQLAPEVARARVDAIANDADAEAYEGDVRRAIEQLNENDDLTPEEGAELELLRLTLKELDARKQLDEIDASHIEELVDELHEGDYEHVEQFDLRPEQPEAEVIDFPAAGETKAQKKSVDAARKVFTQKIINLEKNVTQLKNEKHAMSWISPADWFANFRNWRRIDQEVERNEKAIEDLRFKQLVDVTKANAAAKKKTGAPQAIAAK